VRVHPLDPEGMRLFDTVERAVVVRGATREFGLVRLAHRWGGITGMKPADDGNVADASAALERR
jgi:lipopolysaccharide transport system ATP-binding protein